MFCFEFCKDDNDKTETTEVITRHDGDKLLCERKKISFNTIC